LSVILGCNGFITLLSEARVRNRLVGTSLVAIGTDPLGIRTGFICIPEGSLIWSSFSGSLLSSICSDVSTNDCNVREEFSDFRIGENELAKDAKVVYGLLALAPGLVLGCGWRGALHILNVCLRIELGGMPDEILDQFVVVLDLNKLVGILDNTTEAREEILAFLRELALIEGGMGDEILQSLVNLLVRGELAVTEPLDYSVESHFARDVLLLLGWIGRGSDSIL
jgi:hypothetical protein